MRQPELKCGCPYQATAQNERNEARKALKDLREKSINNLNEEQSSLAFILRVAMEEDHLTIEALQSDLTRLRESHQHELQAHRNQLGQQQCHINNLNTSLARAQHERNQAQTSFENLRYHSQREMAQLEARSVQQLRMTVLSSTAQMNEVLDAAVEQSARFQEEGPGVQPAGAPGAAEESEQQAICSVRSKP
mmetsp:Transcript_25711/g.40281  ORF Transcript_25711/g.40281 Transcript_25711/m.40281 type:complete len:192 (-) Transcript_25711:1237-1812(-)